MEIAVINGTFPYKRVTSVLRASLVSAGSQ